MQHRYKFTGDYPVIASDLSHGPDVVIDSGGDGPGDAPDGSTVTLYPGDTITLPHPFKHALLEPVEEPKTPARKTPAKPAATKKD